MTQPKKLSHWRFEVSSPTGLSIIFSLSKHIILKKVIYSVVEGAINTDNTNYLLFREKGKNVIKIPLPLK